MYDMARSGHLEIRGVRVAFTRSEGVFEALAGIDLDIAQGEFVAIVGRSGCGKSTLFNVVAGLQTVGAGDVILDGSSILGQPGSAGYMMQQDQLFPWRTVLDNVALGCDVIGRPKSATRARARKLMGRFGLQGREKEYPRALSGGMRQRAALMRTLLLDRDLLLLDEPFGALDAITKADMQSWLLDLWEEYRSTVLFITHDVEEALVLADRVIVMAGPPGRVIADLPVPISRPRDHTDVVTSPQFTALKHELLDILKQGAPT
jgi:ABC-type nitrate/sulfonate/bicarbonate transport system ATPase subunit